MGFLSKLAQGTKVLNRISNSVSNVKELLDNAEYEESGIENYFSLSFRNFIPFSFKLYRVLYLCQNRNCHYGCQQPAK